MTGTSPPATSGFPYAIGAPIGPSPWTAITQDMIDQFAEATLDPDPMHIDPQWARQHSPFGEPVAFGFLTIGLLTHLIRIATDTQDRPAGSFINYGFDRLRLIAPVPAGAQVRGTFVLNTLRRDQHDRQIASFGAVVAIADTDRPALVADWLALWMPPSSVANRTDG